MSSPVIDSLLSRVSAKQLGEPAPDASQLRVIFECAVRAPDHGKLRPWRFFVIRGDARQKLSDLFAEGVRRREPGANESQVQKEREKPLRSPMTIAVAAKVVVGHKVPEVEQVLAAGAAAMNILNATHALGFAASWVTGANCYDPAFTKAFGLEATERLIGFIHVGTSAGKVLPVERPDSSQFAVEWGV